MSTEDNSTSPSGRKGWELEQDRKDVTEVLDYAAKEKEEMQALSKLIESKGRLGLFWDSKVPERNKKFYNFFSLSTCNFKDILKEIQKYQEFYEELSKAMDKVKNVKKHTEIEDIIKLQSVICDLKTKLSEMVKAVALGKDSTASSTIFDLHRSFTEKHEKLQIMIQRVECNAATEGMKKATDSWYKSLQEIGVLKKGLESAREIFKRSEDRTNEIMMEKENILRNLEDLSNQNTTLKESLKSVREESERAREELERARTESERARKESEKAREELERARKESEKAREKSEQQNKKNEMQIESIQQVLDKLLKENADMKALLGWNDSINHHSAPM